MNNVEHPVLPWWRVRMVWLVIAGPLLVVLAGLVTAFMAVRGADTVGHAEAATPSLAPAIQARNHAAAPRR